MDNDWEVHAGYKLSASLEPEGIPSTDITEEVKTLYDVVVNSMEWGSGFLSADEMEAAITVGKLLGCDIPEGWEEQVKAQREAEEYQRKLATDREHEKLDPKDKGLAAMSYLASNYWTDIEGKTWKLEDMDPQHQINVLNQIRERAPAFYVHAKLEEELFDPWDDVQDIFSPIVTADMVRVELALGDWEEARAWVEEQPLVKRLKELTNEEGRMATVRRWKERKAKRDPGGGR